MSTATKEGVEKGDTEDANIPTSNLGYEDDTMSDAGGNIAPFTASPKNETSPPTQGIVTASTGQDSDADNLEPISASGFGITGRLPTSATSEMSTKELIAELESKLEAIVLSKARNATVATDAVATNTGPSLATSASDQAQINSNTESPIQFLNVDTFADCLVSPKDETSKDEEPIFEGGMYCQSPLYLDEASHSDGNSLFLGSQTIFEDSSITRPHETAGGASTAFNLSPPPSFGPELMYDNLGPLDPTSVLEPNSPDYVEPNKTRRAFVEQIHDNDGPSALIPMVGAFEKSDIIKKIKADQQGKEAIVDNEEGLLPVPCVGLKPPVPLNMARFDGDSVQRQHQRDDDSICIPTDDDIEMNSAEFRNVRTPADIIHRDRLLPRTMIEHDLANPGNAVQNMDDSPHIIPEAFLVEERDDNVILGYAEPLLPWWKQRRTKLLLVFVFVIFAIMAIIIGVSSSSSSPESERIFLTETTTPTSSAVPTSKPTSPPSSSTVPSSSPTSCSYVISTGMQKLDKPLDSLFCQEVAIHGRNMIVAAQDSNLNYLYVMLYSLEETQWIQNDEYYIFENDGGGCYGYQVALTEGTALVALSQRDADSGNTTVVVHSYEQHSNGLWHKVDDPIVLKNPGGKDYSYVSSLSVDGNIACATASRHRSYFNIFRRNEGAWVQLRSPRAGEAEDCQVTGNTIAVRSDNVQLYQYDVKLDNIALLQSVLPINVFGAMSLSNNYLIYSSQDPSENWDREVYVYHRRNTDQPFVLLQRFKSSDYDIDEFGISLAFDKDVLVVSGRSETVVFSEQNGYLKHALSFQRSDMEDSWSDSLYFSGRIVIVNDYYDLYSFDIKDCTQSLPTQTPSVSSVPSSSSIPTAISTPIDTSGSTSNVGGTSQTLVPTYSFTRVSPPPTKSSPPSESSAPSLTPSLSGPPSETCYWIDVSLVYDDHPEETVWEVLRITGTESGEIVKAHKWGNFQDPTSTESICLTEGSYQFIIRDWDGICCDDREGSYIVSSDGVVIAQGSQFRLEEITSFDIPVDSQRIPSQIPTTSSFPTETCHLISIGIIFDCYPDETSWDVRRIYTEDVESVDDAMVISFDSYNDSEGAASYTDSLCLPEGQYQFTIYDSFGDGLWSWNSCDEVDRAGHYNVTHFDDIIVQGGNFATSETTIFEIPFNETSVVTTTTTRTPTATPTAYPPTVTPWPTSSSSGRTDSPQTLFPTE